MARPRKVPAVLVEATIRRNAKLAALPSDTARLGYFYVVLGEGKLSEPMPGQFASRSQFKEVAGRWARHLDDYIAVKLLEEAPRLCARCKERWADTPPAKGVLVVHDWHEHQYDPRRLERQREYDERQRSEPVSDGVSDAQSDGVSSPVSDGLEPEFLTPISRAPAGGGAPRTPNVERESKSRKSPTAGERARSAGETSRQPRLTKAEHAAWSGFGHEWNAFRVAWLGRGFRLPPTGSATDDDGTSQRAVLWSVVQDWPTRIAAWVSEAPGSTTRDVISHVLEQRGAIRREVGEDDERPAWDTEKREAAESLQSILRRIPANSKPAEVEA